MVSTGPTNVLVCIKRVPDFSGEVLLSEDGQSADARFVGYTIRDHDSCAVELAVQVSSKSQQAQATVLTVGSTESVEQLRLRPRRRLHGRGRGRGRPGRAGPGRHRPRDRGRRP